MSIAPYVKIKRYSHTLYKTKLHELKHCNSNLFYNILCDKITTRGNTESVYSREFKFGNKPSAWENVYTPKMKDLKIPNVCEFNFNLLQKIVPCGKIICK